MSAGPAAPAVVETGTRRADRGRIAVARPCPVRSASTRRSVPSGRNGVASVPAARTAHPGGDRRPDWRGADRPDQRAEQRPDPRFERRPDWQRPDRPDRPPVIGNDERRGWEQRRGIEQRGEWDRQQRDRRDWDRAQTDRRWSDDRARAQRGQDRNWGDRDWGNRGWSDRGGYDRRNGWDRQWRNDGRYDWSRYRALNRGAYRLPRYYAPSGWGYGYRRFGIGVSLAPVLFSQSYWIDDPFTYRLPEAYGPYRWVRYYDDALLVDIRTGQVVDTVYDIFF